MQTSLSPSVCRAFLGCQIEKAVDELNLPKKIISCHPSSLPLPDHVDCFVALNRSPSCHSRSRSPIPIIPRLKCVSSISVSHTSGACSWYRTRSEAIESALLLRDARPAMSEDNMKKQSKRKARTSDQMRPEYDFSKGVRGKHAARYASGTNVVVLAPDVASQFRTADDVPSLRAP
jgi:hypothetical protein